MVLRHFMTINLILEDKKENQLLSFASWSKLWKYFLILIIIMLYS